MYKIRQDEQYLLYTLNDNSNFSLTAFRVLKKQEKKWIAVVLEAGRKWTYLSCVSNIRNACFIVRGRNTEIAGIIVNDAADPGNCECYS